MTCDMTELTSKKNDMTEPTSKKNELQILNVQMCSFSCHKPVIFTTVAERKIGMGGRRATNFVVCVIQIVPMAGQTHIVQQPMYYGTFRSKFECEHGDLTRTIPPYIF